MKDYKCHKVVKAAKITNIKPMQDGGGFELELEGGGSVFAQHKFMEQHKPEV